MFEIHFIVFLDLINIYTDTQTIKIEVFIANLQAHPVFRAAILNFEFLAGKPRATIWFPLFFNSAYSKNPRCKFSCFYPEVHDMAEKCHISAPLYRNIGKICGIEQYSQQIVYLWLFLLKKRSKDNAFDFTAIDLTIDQSGSHQKAAKRALECRSLRMM